MATFTDLSLSLAGVSDTTQAPSGALRAMTSVAFTTTPLPLTVATQQTCATTSGLNSVISGDFNLDGKPELASASDDSDSVSVLLGNGDGTFQAQQTFAVGLFPFSVVCDDFN